MQHRWEQHGLALRRLRGGWREYRRGARASHVGRHEGLEKRGCGGLGLPSRRAGELYVILKRLFSRWLGYEWDTEWFIAKPWSTPTIHSIPLPFPIPITY